MVRSNQAAALRIRAMVTMPVPPMPQSSKDLRASRLSASAALPRCCLVRGRPHQPSGPTGATPASGTAKRSTARAPSGPARASPAAEAFVPPSIGVNGSSAATVPPSIVIKDGQNPWADDDARAVSARHQHAGSLAASSAGAAARGGDGNAGAERDGGGRNFEAGEVLVAHRLVHAALPPERSLHLRRPEPPPAISEQRRATRARGWRGRPPPLRRSWT